jgi:hypothetical protein
MSEQLFFSSHRERQFHIDHGLEYETEEAYFLRKGEVINNGGTAWMAHNFDPAVDGRVYGLWMNHQEIAMVDNEDNANFRVYVRDLDDGDTFLCDTNSLIEAVDVAERYWGLIGS